MFKRSLVLALCAGSVCLAGNGWAQQKFDVGEWEPLSAGPGTTWTAPLVEKGKLAVQPFAMYNRTRGTFDNDGHYSKLPKGDKKSQYQQQIFAQYGVSEKFEIDAQTVYQENFIKQGGVNGHAHGVGDSFLYARYGLLDTKTTGWDVTALAQLKFPTGKYQKGTPEALGTDIMGTGSWDHGYGLVVTKELKPFVFHLDGIYSFPSTVRVDGVKTDYANYINYDAAVEYFLPVKGWNLLLELNGVAQGDQKLDEDKAPATDTNSLILSPGIGWSNDKVQTLISYQRVIAGENADANDSVMATLVYTF